MRFTYSLLIDFRATRFIDGFLKLLNPWLLMFLVFTIMFHVAVLGYCGMKVLTFG